MTTTQRVWYEGAAYHITARGNHRNDIFRDDEDFQYYLTVIEEALRYYGNNNYKLICYCLMDNHVHLMIKTDDKPLASSYPKQLKKQPKAPLLLYVRGQLKEFEYSKIF